MPGHKLGRITEDVKRELSAILREVKDPRVKDCFLSIVRVGGHQRPVLLHRICEHHGGAWSGPRPR